PRFCLRPGYLEAIEKIGVEVGSRRTANGLEVEFKLPWANFPAFKAAEGAVIALDSELCYSDGAERLYRSFVFGSPLSVQQPASLARIQLVNQLTVEHWARCGAVMFPMRVDTAWGQSTKPQVTGMIALSPDQADDVGRVVFRLTHLDGSVIAEFPAEREVFEMEGNFVRAKATWPVDIAAPGKHHVTAIIHDTSWTERARVAPRLVSVNWETGY
ncbi:MAG: sugar-binding protein, partial [Verrucomicrobiales bacterium]